MKDFNDKVVMITGASSGIGAEFARQFNSLGARVVLIARREEKLEKLKKELNSLRENSAEYLICDLCSDFELDFMVKYIRDHKIDILINNAGCGSFGFYEELDIDKEVDQVKLNIIATQKLSHAIIPQLKARKEGAIISTSSIAAFQPLPYMSTYAATKSFNYTHSLGLRAELSDFGVKVLVVCPGPTATEFGGVARVPGKMTGVSRDSVEKVVKISIKALRKNKAFVITGFRAKLYSIPSRFFPVSLSLRLVKKALYSSLVAIKK